MGLKAADYALLAGQLGGGLLGGLFAPEGQERQSFEGTDVSPLAMMRQSNQFTNNLGKALAGRVAGGVNLPSAYVQQPGAYTGGGMAMPIGVVASDPALANPSLLSRQGLGAFENLWGVPGAEGTDDPNIPDRTSPTPDGKRTDGEDRVVPRGPARNEPQALSATRRRSDIGSADGEYGQLVRASDLSSDDDLEQGIGAVQLLMEAFGAGR